LTQENDTQNGEDITEKMENVFGEYTFLISPEHEPSTFEQAMESDEPPQWYGGCEKKD